MIKINLLAEAKPAKKKRGVSALGAAGRLNVILLALFVGIGFVAIGIEFLVRSKALKDMDEKIRVAQAEVTRLEAVLREVKDYEDKKAKLQKKVDLINQLKANQRGPVRLMDEVSKALPDLLWLETMEYKGNDIRLSGRALNPNAAANFIENLKRVPSFQEPKLGDISACGGGGGSSLYCFTLSFGFSNIDKTQGAAPGEGAPATSTPTADRGASREGTAVAADVSRPAGGSSRFAAGTAAGM